MRRLINDLYQKLSSGAALVASLRAHDEQIAQLRATIAALLAEAPNLSQDQKQAAIAKIEGLLAYQAISCSETGRLRELYEAATTRVAKAESEIEELRRRLEALEQRGLQRANGEQS